MELMMKEETKLDLEGATASQEQDGGDIKDQTSDSNLVKLWVRDKVGHLEEFQDQQTSFKLKMITEALKPELV